MARFRKIDPRIWNDAKFASLSNEAKLLFMYLLTSPSMTILGALPMRASAVAEELGLDSKRYAIRYEELSRLGMAEYDDRGLFWVRNYLKYNSPDNPKVVLSWPSALDLLPECPLLANVLDAARNHCCARGDSFLKAFEDGIGDRFVNRIANGMSYGMAYKEKEKEKEKNIRRDALESSEIFSQSASPIEAPSMPHRSQEQEQEQEQKQVRAPASAKKPTAITHTFDLQELPEDWKQYCLDRRPDLDPHLTFVDFKGWWTTGKGSGTRRSDKSWTSTWQTWVRNQKEGRQQQAAAPKRSIFAATPETTCMKPIDRHAQARGDAPDPRELFGGLI